MTNSSMVHGSVYQHGMRVGGWGTKHQLAFCSEHAVDAVFITSCVCMWALVSHGS